MQRKLIQCFTMIFLVLAVISGTAQQIPDTNFTFSIAQSAYPEEGGPIVYIDEAHNNFHTMSGGFSPFAKLLEEDGYNVEGSDKLFSESDALVGCKILVIANALNARNIGSWTLPTPSAFTQKEIHAVREWVANGGLLLLLADHMPFAGAAQELGNAFGFEFLNGFAMTGEQFWPPSVFTKDAGLVSSSPVDGMHPFEKIDTLTTFTGSAFTIPAEATPVLRFSDNHTSLQPDTAWSFHGGTPAVQLGGYYQGAIMDYGQGRIAVFGEAAMFTAQIAGGNVKAGFNSDYAPQNAQFVINIIHWLDGVNQYSGKVDGVRVKKIEAVLEEKSKGGE